MKKLNDLITSLNQRKSWTLYISLGDSKSIVGENEAEIHMDFVVNKPTVRIDGKKLMVGGELKL